MYRVEERYLFLLTAPHLLANTHFYKWIDLSAAVVAHPLKVSLCLANSLVRVIASSGITKDDVMVENLFTNRVAAVVL